MVMNTELIKMTLHEMCMNGTQDTSTFKKNGMYFQACNSLFRRTLTGTDITSEGGEFNVT